MSRARDSQRQRVYDAEKFLQDVGPRMETVAEIQAYVDHLLSSAWFRRRWPRVARKGIEVRDGRGRRRAVAETIWGVNLIRMPAWSRSKAVILHEVAHHCTDEAHGLRDVAAHGWQFAGTLLELVTHEMDDVYGMHLKDRYKAEKVRFKAPRRRKPLTEEQRAVLVQRMAIARAAKEAKSARL